MFFPLFFPLSRASLNSFYGRVFLAASLLAATSSFAQSDDDPNSSARVELPPLVVTATRTAQTADQSLAAVSVITREEIERKQAASVTDLLRSVPGLNITQNGPPGSASASFLRGTESDHVVVLIDGMKIGAATTGNASFQDIPVDIIERIEVVRGPRSSLYGSEAIGGVIQIFTREGGRQSLNHGSVTFGSHETLNGAIGTSGELENGIRYSLNLSVKSTEGFNACDGANGGVAGCFTAEPDEDGYRNQSVTARFGRRFDSGADLQFNLVRTEGEIESDANTLFAPNFSETSQLLLGSRLFIPINDIWDSSVQISRTTDDIDSYANGAFFSRFNTERDNLAWQNDVAIGDDHLLTAGFDYLDERIEASNALNGTERANQGLFAQLQLGFDATDISLSLRHDDNEQFGGFQTGNAAIGVALSERVRLTAGFGQAFKAPTFNELFFPGFGNANLRPERSENIEIGLGWESPFGSLGASLYQTETEDLIAFDVGILAANNVEKARITGLETHYSGEIGQTRISANLTLQEPLNLSSTNNGKLLVRRPEQIFNLSLDRPVGRYRLGADLRAEGRRYDNLNNTRAIDEFATLDLRIETPVDRHWLLQGKVVNLFDTEYETASFFYQEERAFYLTLRYTP